MLPLIRITFAYALIATGFASSRTTEPARKEPPVDPVITASALTPPKKEIAMRFFRLDALSSMVGLKEDFNPRIASSLYRLLAE